MFEGTIYLYNCDLRHAEKFFTVGKVFGLGSDCLRIDEVVWGPEKGHETSTMHNGPWRAKIKATEVPEAPNPA